MAEGRDRAAWNHTAAIRHTIASAFSDESYTIAEFHAYDGRRGPASHARTIDITEPAGMELLALAFVPRYRDFRRLDAS